MGCILIHGGAQGPHFEEEWDSEEEEDLEEHDEIRDKAVAREIEWPEKDLPSTDGLLFSGIIQK